MKIDKLQGMIALPNIPTDNLYKFCFVAGIILILSAAYLNYLADKLNLSALEQTVLLEYDLHLQKSDNDRLRKVDSLLSDTTTDGRAFFKSDFYKDDIKPLMNSNRLDSITKLNAKMNATIDEAKSVATISNLLLLLGFALTTIGGACWYLLNQKVQDNLLNVQLRSAEIELETLEIRLQDLKNKNVDVAD